MEHQRDPVETFTPHRNRNLRRACRHRETVTQKTPGLPPALAVKARAESVSIMNSTGAPLGEMMSRLALRDARRR
jgi:hypothetical protein